GLVSLLEQEVLLMIRKLLGMGVVAATLAISSNAFAGGANISWVQCSGEANAATNRTFACGTNTGSDKLVCSFNLSADLNTVSGNELVTDVLTTPSPLPPWWNIHETGDCRPAGFAMNTTADDLNVVCQDWALGASSGGIGAFDSPPG